MLLSSLSIRRLVVCAMGVALIGCAPKMKITVTRPAEINLRGAGTLALGDIQGNGGETLRGELETAIFQSGYFTVLDRTNLRRILSEQRIAGGSRQLAAATALVSGRVSRYDYTETTDSDTYTDKKGVTHTTRSRTGEVHLTVSLQITDLASGQLLESSAHEASKKTRESATDGQPDAIDQQALMAVARREVVADFMRRVAPRQETLKVAFRKHSDPLVKQGIALAKADQLPQALTALQQAADRNPDSPEVLFDLAVLQELSGQYTEASATYQRSFSLDPSDGTMEAMTRNNTLAEDQSKLRAQGFTR